ncbi:MAG: lptA [Burkholderiales bacterium]|jgi:lipopolysaccharide export system protein LptA|nr:lptA [Burkholderiales bacterium]
MINKKWFLYGMVIMTYCIPVVSYAGVSSDESKPIQIEADHATLDQKQMVTVFSGRVVITHGTLVVHANQGTATQDSGGDKTLLLTGNPVTFVQKADDGELIEGQGNRFDYNTKTSLAILSGRARVKKGKNLIVGDTLTYNTKTLVYSAAAAPANGVKPGKTSGRITVILDGQNGAVKK